MCVSIQQIVTQRDGSLLSVKQLFQDTRLLIYVNLLQKVYEKAVMMRLSNTVLHAMINEI